MKVHHHKSVNKVTELSQAGRLGSNPA